MRAYPGIWIVVVVVGTSVETVVGAVVGTDVVVGTVVDVVAGCVVLVAVDVVGALDTGIVVEVAGCERAVGGVVGVPVDECRVTRIPTTAPAAPSRTSAPTRAAVHARRLPGRRPRGRTSVSAADDVGSAAAGAWSRAARAAPSAGRCRGSFARAAVATAARFCGTSGRTSSIGGGFVCRCICASFTGDSLSNGSRPVSMRYSNTPNE